MTTQQQLAKTISTADANAIQAAKDGRLDAKAQWESVAREAAKELAEINRERLQKLLGK